MKRIASIMRLQEYGKILSMLRSILRNKWFFILWGFVGVVVVVGLFIGKPYLATLGISSGAFSTLFGVVAALSGALLGLIIAAISLITQYSSYNFYNSKDILSRELRSVESFLATNSFQNHELYNDLSEKLDNLRHMCNEVLNIPIKEEKFDEYRNIVSSAIESSGHFLNVYKYKLNILIEECDVLATADATKDEIQIRSKEVQDMKKEIPFLNDLQRSILAISSAIIRMLISALSSRLPRELVKLAYAVGFILVFSIAYLALSGITLSGIGILSDYQKICSAIIVILLLILAIVMMFLIVSLHLKIVGIEIDKKLSF